MKSSYFLIDLHFNAIYESLINLDSSIFLLDLPLQRHPEIFNRRRNLHLLFAHHESLVFLMQISLQSLDDSFRLAHFLEYLVILCLEAGHLLLYRFRHLEPLILLVLQFTLDALKFLLVLLLHLSKGIHQFLDYFEGLLDGVVLVVSGGLGSLLESFAALGLELLLEFDDAVGELFYFLLVDVREVLGVGVVEFFDGFG